MEEIEECINLDRTNEAEIFYVSYFRSLGFKLNNHTGGGGGMLGVSRKLSQEARDNLSAIRTGTKASSETKALLSAQRKGVKKSPKHREALFAANAARGKIRSTKHRLALEVGNIFRSKRIVDDLGNVYGSVGAVARTFGVSRGAIRRAVQGKVKRSLKTGRIFKYLKEK